uniref:Mucin-3A-like n=1 Tax=Erpetoichthys calabaricus TaxID=27687 RepID=A0A8C4TBE1_ERPCA
MVWITGVLLFLFYQESGADPGTIGNLTVTYINTNSVGLIWTTQSSNAVGYKVKGLGPTNTTMIVNSESALVTGLIPGSKYTMEVILLTGDNMTEGPAVTTIVFTKPEAVGELSVDNITTSSIGLSWYPPTGNAIGYIIETVQTYATLICNPLDISSTTNLPTTLETTTTPTVPSISTFSTSATSTPVLTTVLSSPTVSTSISSANTAFTTTTISPTTETTVTSPPVTTISQSTTTISPTTETTITPSTLTSNTSLSTTSTPTTLFTTTVTSPPVTTISQSTTTISPTSETTITPSTLTSNTSLSTTSTSTTLFTTTVTSPPVTTISQTTSTISPTTETTSSTSALTSNTSPSTTSTPTTLFTTTVTSPPVTTISQSTTTISPTSETTITPSTLTSNTSLSTTSTSTTLFTTTVTSPPVTTISQTTSTISPTTETTSSTSALSSNTSPSTTSTPTTLFTTTVTSPPVTTISQSTTTISPTSETTITPSTLTSNTSLSTTSTSTTLFTTTVTSPPVTTISQSTTTISPTSETTSSTSALTSNTSPSTTTTPTTLFTTTVTSPPVTTISQSTTTISPTSETTITPSTLTSNTSLSTASTSTTLFTTTVTSPPVTTISQTTSTISPTTETTSSTSALTSNTSPSTTSTPTTLFTTTVTSPPVTTISQSTTTISPTSETTITPSTLTSNTSLSTTSTSTTLFTTTVTSPPVTTISQTTSTISPTTETTSSTSALTSNTSLSTTSTPTTLFTTTVTSSPVTTISQSTTTISPTSETTITPSTLTSNTSLSTTSISTTLFTTTVTSPPVTTISQSTTTISPTSETTSSTSALTSNTSPSTTTTPTTLFTTTVPSTPATSISPSTSTLFFETSSTLSTSTLTSGCLTTIGTKITTIVYVSTSTTTVSQGDTTSTSLKVSAVINGLSPGENYTIQVTALAEDNITKGASVNISAFTKPGTVTNVTIHNIMTNSISLSWTPPVGNPASYIVEVAGTTASNVTAYSASANVTGLTPGSIYTLQVVALAQDNLTEGDAVAITAVTKPGVVYNLTISNISSSSLFLSWTPPNGNVGRYTVEVSGSTVMNVTTTSAFANLTGLIPDSIYTLQVVALAVDNMTEGDAVAITGITKPGVVYNLTISNISTSSLFLSWTPPNGNVGSYRVDVSGSTVMNVTTTSAFANLTGLIPGSMYTLQVVALAVDNMTEGDAVAITGITKPGVVYNLTISNISTSSLFLSWTPPNGNVGSYRVDVSGSTVMNVTTTSAFANLTGLIPGSMYTLQVVALAVDNMTEGDAVAITGITKPGVVYNLTISNISTSSLFLSWTPPNGNVGSYRVDVSGSTVMNVTTTSAFANLTGLIPGSMYTLQVVALAVDNMTEGDAVAITGITKPGVVYNLTISNISTSSLFLSWTPPNGNVGSYRVDVSGSTVMNVTTTSAFANLTGLIPGSMYTLQVVALAVDNMTEGDAVAITGITKPDVVYNLTISNISTSSLFLSWTPPNGNVGSYRVDVSGSTVMNVTTTSAFANLTGLIPGSMYTLQVVALAVDNMTEGDAVAITGITKPGVVYNLTISNISTSSLFLSWTPPNGNVGSYRVDVSGSTVMNVTTTSAFANLTGLIPGS